MINYSKYELVLKRVKVTDSKCDYNVTCSKDAYNFATKIMKLHEKPEEHFCIITLNSKGDIIGYSEVSKGSLCSSEAHPREVFKLAIIQNAAAIICFHNHPSGHSVPSPEDINTTKRLIDASNILGIPVLDHVIIGEKEFTSLKAEGYI